MWTNLWPILVLIRLQTKVRSVGFEFHPKCPLVGSDCIGCNKTISHNKAHSSSSAPQSCFGWYKSSICPSALRQQLLLQHRFEECLQKKISPFPVVLSLNRTRMTRQEQARQLWAICSIFMAKVILSLGMTSQLKLEEIFLYAAISY